MYSPDPRELNASRLSCRPGDKAKQTFLSSNALSVTPPHQGDTSNHSRPSWSAVGSTGSGAAADAARPASPGSSHTHSRPCRSAVG